MTDTFGNLSSVAFAAEGGYLWAINTLNGAPIWSSQPTLIGNYLDTDPLYPPQATCCC